MNPNDAMVFHILTIKLPLAWNLVFILAEYSLIYKKHLTINHEILISKMEYLGFSKDVIFWFRSYLSNRKFKVNSNKTFSEPGKLLCGIPQGSILEPLLHLIYINGMPKAVKCKFLLYADDTCQIFQCNDIKEIEIQFNKNLTLIWDWFVDNKLSIHVGEDKTKWVLFSSELKIKKASPLNIQYINMKIKQYRKGTHRLHSWRNSLENLWPHVTNKVNYRLRFAYTNKFLDIPFCRLLCNAMVWLLIMHVTLSTLILTKIQKTFTKLLRANPLDCTKIRWNNKY